MQLTRGSRGGESSRLFLQCLGKLQSKYQYQQPKIIPSLPKSSKRTKGPAVNRRMAIEAILEEISEQNSGREEGLRMECLVFFGGNPHSIPLMSTTQNALKVDQ